MALELNGTTGVSLVQDGVVVAADLNSALSDTIGKVKAWVNFNGTGTVAIRASFNVSTITDNGPGNYTVNFTTAMSDAAYCISAHSSYSDTAINPEYNLMGNCIKSTGSLQISTGYISTLSANLTLGDRLVNDVAIFR